MVACIIMCIAPHQSTLPKEWLTSLNYNVYLRFFWTSISDCSWLPRIVYLATWLPQIMYLFCMFWSTAENYYEMFIDGVAYIYPIVTSLGQQAQVVR